MLKEPSDFTVSPIVCLAAPEQSLASDRLTTTSGSIEVTPQESIDGVRVYSAKITDEYAPSTDEAKRTYSGVRETISLLEEGLRSDDPAVVAQTITEGRAHLDSSPTIRAWKGWMTTAMALYPLQRPLAPQMLDGTPVDAFAHELFLYGQDAVGIRDRGALFSHLVTQRDGKIDTIISLACGAAVPECDAIKAMTKKPKATIVDMDERALSHVMEVAKEAGLPEGTFTSVTANLVKDFMFAPQPHPAMQKEHFDVADLLGITEYFKDRHMKILLEKAYELVKPGGMLIFGNMLDTHPTLQFNQQVVEWPGVIPRSRELLAEISSQIAGASNVEMYIPESGVYAVLKLEKPEANQAIPRPLGGVALVHS